MTIQKRRTQVDRREEAESKLIDAAVSLIAHNGFKGFTLAEVGQTAGYSRGLPVHYFASKDQLIERVAEHIVERYYAGLSTGVHAERGLPMLIEMIRQYANLLKKGDDSMRAFSFLLAQAPVNESVGRAFTKLNTKGTSTLQEQITAGIDAGHIKSSIDAATSAQMIYAFLRGALMFSVSSKDFDPSAVVEQFICTTINSFRVIQ
ncbi:TetR/AcrR family transcriptional regulator [Spongiibacter sp. KMU-166]|uniref:TetR/AcrR family transcriptional regulator n=1 Tax=Spongiibacter thalassae TaxID=2721624 RepID=A0ABX1GAQ9_9GAMM|nr:TetR/AcrR family transcriptional regulator [Spongiibacter thalassae]NKI16249.1 TetR/AcrR family transcriptional regulator [Spongiibacter thalassae]